MMNKYPILAVILILASCSPKIYPSTIKTDTKDSVRIEIRERVIIDTVTIEIPTEVQKYITRDSISFLENTFATSTASVDSLGFLHHSLESKSQKISHPVPHVVHDTLYYEKTIRIADTTNVVEVEKRLTKWQSFEMVCGDILLCLLALLLLYIIVKIVLKYIK